MAIQTRHVVLGVTMGSLAALVAWMIGSSIAKTREKEHQQRMAAEAERTERERLLTAKTTALNAIRDGDVFKWDLYKQGPFELDTGEYAALAYKPKAEDCPAYAALEQRVPRDEFEKRERESKLRDEAQFCYQRRVALMPPRPSIAVVEVPFRSVDEYDFTEKAIKLWLPYFEVKCRYYVDCRAVGDPIMARAMSGAFVVGTSDHSSFGHLLVIDDAVGSPFTSTTYVPLKVSEERARELKHRLVGSHPRLLIAFKPTGYGPTPYSFDGELGKGSALQGILAKAVGYRISDDAGDIIAWTPFGKDGSGTEVPPRFKYDGAPTVASLP